MKYSVKDISATTGKDEFGLFEGELRLFKGSIEVLSRICEKLNSADKIKSYVAVKFIGASMTNKYLKVNLDSGILKSTTFDFVADQGMATKLTELDAYKYKEVLESQNFSSIKFTVI